MPKIFHSLVMSIFDSNMKNPFKPKLLFDLEYLDVLIHVEERDGLSTVAHPPCPPDPVDIFLCTCRFWDLVRGGHLR